MALDQLSVSFSERMNHVLFHIILNRLLFIVSLLLLIYDALTIQWKSIILRIRNIDLLKNVQLVPKLPF